jgi:hypothetical protein
MKRLLRTPPNRLQPAKDLFDPFSLALTDSVALGARRTAVEPGRPAPGDAGDVRTDGVLTQVSDKVFDVIALVRTQGLRVNASVARSREQLAGRLMLSLRGIGDQDIDTQSMAIFHQYVPAIAQFGGLAVALAHEPGVRIGGAPVGRIRSLLAFEVGHPGTVTPFLRRLTVRAFEALEGRSGLDQGAVDREVIRREQVLTASQAHYFVEETPGNVGGDQSLAQAAEIRLVEPFALEVHVKKPAKENVVVKLLAELPVRANRVERDQQLTLQQAFRCN